VSTKPSKIQSFLASLQEVEQRERSQRAIRSLTSGGVDAAEQARLLAELAESSDPAARNFVRRLNALLSTMDPDEFR
jgi:hypothetical protein